MGKKKKTPYVAASPADRKLPSATAIAPLAQKRPAVGVSPTTFNNEFPSWRIARLELADPFGWHQVGAATILDIREKLASFESMTWNEILVKAKKQNHSVEVSSLCKPAQDRLVAIRLFLDELVTLRLGGAERVWGYRTGSVLNVLWWDPDHQVCPSLLKHT